MEQCSGNYPSYESGFDNLPIFTDFNYNNRISYEIFKDLHGSAKNALEGIFPNITQVTGISLNPENLLDLGSEYFDAEEVISQSSGIIAFTAICAILGVILTLVGIFWCLAKVCGCICCCAKKCSKPKKPKELIKGRFGNGNSTYKTRNSTCKIVLGVFLFGCLIVYLTFLVALFVSNDQLREPIHSFSVTLNEHLEDTQAFLDTAKIEFNYILVTAYDQLAIELRKYLCSKQISASKILLNSSVHKNFVDTLQDQNNLLNVAACSEIDRVGAQLKKDADALNDTLDVIPIETVRKDIEELENTILDVENGIFISGTVINVFLLIILFILSIGLLMIFLPKVKKFGSCSLNCSLALIFISVLILWVIALALLLISGAFVVVLPQAFYAVVELDKLVGEGNGDITDPGYQTPNLHDILQSCKNDESSYRAFGLKQVFDLDSLDELLEIFFPASSGLLLEDGQENKSILLKNLYEIVDSDQKNISIPIRLMDNIQQNEIEAECQLIRYIQFAKNTIDLNVANCEPLYKVVDRVVSTFSYDIGSPIAVYWFSLTLILFFFYPIVIASFFIS